MTAEESLLQLGDSTAEAVNGVLAGFLGDQVENGSAVAVADGVSPLDNLAVPAVASNVSYVDGVRGGNVFVITALGARRLAAMMMGEQPPESGDEELSELELSAVGEAMNQAMAAAASATSRVLRQDVEIGAPTTRFFATQDEALGAFDVDAHATTVSFTVCGEPARLVQLVPNAFVVRMTKALEDLAAMVVDENAQAPDGVQGDALRDVHVRLWAELGRFRMPVGRAVSLVPGSVVELDALVDDPVELFLNGTPFARGRLLVAEDGEWAVRLEEIVAREPDQAALGGN